jgi:hypothetical protein
MTAGQVQGESLEAGADPATDLDQAQAQGAELQVGQLEVGQPAADGIEEPVGRCVQQRARNPCSPIGAASPSSGAPKQQSSTMPRASSEGLGPSWKNDSWRKPASYVVHRRRSKCITSEL